jgi:hypothetical protein
MSTKIKFAAVALAAVTLAGGLAVTSTEAQAKGGKKALAFGIATGVLLGAAAASANANSVAYGYRRCHWERQYDFLGRYIGSERVCEIY